MDRANLEPYNGYAQKWMISEFGQNSALQGGHCYHNAARIIMSIGKIGALALMMLKR